MKAEEWKHGDGRPFGKRQRRAAWGPVRANAIDAHRPFDILELLLAHVSDVEGQLPLDLLIGTVRKADRAWLGQRLDPGSDIDSIAVNVAFVGE